MKQLAILLLVFHIGLESSEIYEHIYPASASVYIHPFINYTWPHDPRGISLLWWINYCSNDLLWIVTYFVLAKISLQYSYAMFRVAMVFFVYHVIGHFMLWYNYRTGHFMYYILGVACTWCIVAIFSKDKKHPPVRSMV